MTLDHDFMQIKTVFHGKVITTLKSQRLEWPPPELMVFSSTGHFVEATKESKRSEMFERYSMSSLTDDQAKKCPNVARGAAYRYVDPIDADVGHA